MNFGLLRTLAPDGNRQLRSNRKIPAVVAVQKKTRGATVLNCRMLKQRRVVGVVVVDQNIQIGNQIGVLDLCRGKFL